MWDEVDMLAFGWGGFLFLFFKFSFLGSLQGWRVDMGGLGNEWD